MSQLLKICAGVIVFLFVVGLFVEDEPEPVLSYAESYQQNRQWIDEVSNTGNRPNLIGKANLTWSALGVTYFGTLEMNGEFGVLDVSFIADRSTFIRQDIFLHHHEGIWFLTGTNPRHRYGGNGSANYSPDVFQVTFMPNGDWTIEQMCDLQGLCSPVKTTAAN